MASVRAANNPEPVRTEAAAISPRVNRHHKDSTNPFPARLFALHRLRRARPCPALSAARCGRVGDEPAGHVARLGHLGEVLCEPTLVRASRHLRLGAPPPPRSSATDDSPSRRSPAPSRRWPSRLSVHAYELYSRRLPATVARDAFERRSVRRVSLAGRGAVIGECSAGRAPRAAETGFRAHRRTPSVMDAGLLRGWTDVTGEAGEVDHASDRAPRPQLPR
jgi:hypothetical protein